MSECAKPSRTLEAAVYLGLALEDSFKANLQHSINNHMIPHPKTGTFEDYLAYNSGDLIKGYIFAMAADYIINKTIDKAYYLSAKMLGEDSRVSRSIDYLRKDANRINITSGIISSLAIVFFETTGLLNTPDIKDIPAGIAGAMMHTGLRYVPLRHFRYKYPQYAKTSGNVS